MREPDRRRRVMSDVATELDHAISRLELAGRPVCAHSALRSFAVRIAPETLVERLLAVGCTVLVPTFSSAFAAPPPAGHTPLPLNSEDDGSIPSAVPARGYSPQSSEVDPSMGAVPRAVLAHPAHVRGDHPLSSFAAVGPLAGELVRGQSAHDVFAPLRTLAARAGAVLLVGVDLSAATALHLAEEQAGYLPLVRWARGPEGTIRTVRHGGCSRGFEGLAPALTHLQAATDVLGSRWRAYPARALIDAAARLFAGDAGAGRCADPRCARCRDRRHGQHRT